MHSFQEYLSQGNAWLFLPAAVVLGALHGLEPGHSKTMMAAFIIAVRGTVTQAVLLGLAATFSHTALIWVLAFVGLHYAGSFSVEDSEPYFQAGTGAMVVALAVWMFWRIRRDQRPHCHGHGHAAGEGAHGGMVIDTGHGHVELSVFETNVPPRFRVRFLDERRGAKAPPAGTTVTVETVRDGGVRQMFTLEQRGDFLEAADELPEPHEFQAVLRLTHAGHTHSFAREFAEGHDHDHAGHGHGGPGHHDAEGGLQIAVDEDADAHEREHAAELQARFSGGHVTTGQIILFGLSGGLMPCPSAFAVLLVCLQVKQFTLGFAVVLAFSVGLAATMVGIGSLAALSARQASRRFAGFGKFARRMPYASAGIMVALGLALTLHGLMTILRR